MNIHESLNTAFHKEVEENRAKLRSINHRFFCGKQVFLDLKYFRGDSGNGALITHRMSTYMFTNNYQLPIILLCNKFSILLNPKAQHPATN